MDKYTQINLILKDYFDLNLGVKQIHAKDMMPYFVLAGIFKKDEKKWASDSKFNSTIGYQ